MNEVPTPNYCYYQLAADDKWTSGSAEKLVLVKAAGSNSILFGKQCKKAPAISRLSHTHASRSFANTNFSLLSPSSRTQRYLQPVSAEIS